MEKPYLSLLLISAFSANAYASKPFAVTPSGATETVFYKPPAEASASLGEFCMDSEMQVIRSSETEVLCEAPLSMGQSVLGQMLIGNSYSTPPRRFFRFNVVKGASATRVQASGWMETQMAFGQVNRAEFSGADFHNGAMNMMLQAGAEYPPGTTFPNHAYIGFDGESQGTGRAKGLKVTSVFEGSAGEKAGLLKDDVVVRVAGRRVEDEDDFFTAAERAARRPQYDVEILRDGERKTLKLQTEYRPPIEAPAEAAEFQQQTVSAAEEAETGSVADEIRKLAQLRDE